MMDTMIIETTDTSAVAGSNQPEMTPEQAKRDAMRFARECGKAVASGKMSLTTFVEKLLPLAHVTKQFIKADDAKELWVENATAETGRLGEAFHEPVNPEGNSKAANGSKLRQPLKLANSVDYASELLQDTLDEIARLKKGGEKTKSVYPAFVDVCRAQLKRTDNRLTSGEIADIVCVGVREQTEQRKLEQAAAALKAAAKLRDEAGEPVQPAMIRAAADIDDRIATLKQVALQAKARQAAVAAGLTVV
jgi:hypothetical protein